MLRERAASRKEGQLVPRLTELTTFSDAQRYATRDALWALFDGTPDRLNISHECLDRHRGCGPAIRIAGPEGPRADLSFDDLADWSSRFANFLASRGIRKGDRVAVMAEPSLAFYMAMFGAMKAGAVAVPLFTLFGPDGLRLRVADCRPALLLVDADKAEVARDAGAAAVRIVDDTLMAEVAAFPTDFDVVTKANDLALFQYTSGTTREVPEAIPHTHGAVVVVMLAALYGVGLRPEDRYFCPSSPAWGHGMWHGTISPLAMGATTGAWAGKFEPGPFVDALVGFHITNLAAAATHYRMIRNSGAAEGRRFDIAKLSFTGEPMDGATADYVEDLFGTPACSMYGTTETGVILVNYPGAPDFTVKRGSLGKPVPGVEVQVQDAAGRPCPPGVTGELKVRRRGAWFPTKDLGMVDVDGYFFHGGRADDVIISAGWTMGAAEIEDALLKHPDVAEAAVVGVPDALRGQVVKAFIVSARSGDDAFTAELQNFVRTRLSQHEYPRQTAYVAELPKTPAGKVNRRALRAQEAAQRKEDA